MTGKKITKVIAYILLILAIVAIIGLIAKFTGGFSGGFKTFYVTIDGKDIMTSGSGYSVSPTEPLQVEVKYVFESDENTEKDYTVKVIPNAVSGKDFDFSLDGDVYSYQAEKDLTAGFIIEKGESSFTLTPKGGTLTEVLQAIYPDYTVGDCEALGYEDMFTLVVTSYDGEASVKIHFAISATVGGIILDQEVIVF